MHCFNPLTTHELHTISVIFKHYFRGKVWQDPQIMTSGISGKVDAMKGASIFRRVMSTFVRAGNGRPFRDDAHISRVSSCRGPAACDLHACQPRQQRKSV